MRDAASPAIAGGLCAALAGWLTVVLGLLRKPVLVGIKSYLLPLAAGARSSRSRCG